MRRILFACFLTAAIAIADDYPGSPAAVVAAYIEADRAGDAFSKDSTSQLLKYTTWNSLPDTHSFIVMDGYEIGEVGWTGDEAGVHIVYKVIGHIKDLRFVAKASEEEVDFDLKKLNGQWKIVKPQLPPHVTVDRAIEFLRAAGSKGEAATKQLGEVR